MTPQDLYRDMHNRPDWQRDAVCAQADPEAWFPEKGGSTLAAKKICLACDVRAQCLAYALDNQERFGVWGGYSERERRRLIHDRDAIPTLTRGGSQGFSLNEDEESELMERLSEGWSLRRVADEFGISRSAATRVRDRRYKQNGAAA